jgi:hypothetical protein
VVITPLKSARFALGGIALLITIATPPAAARASSDAGTAADRALQARIDRIVDANPGAVQLSSTEVQLDEGVTMEVPAAGQQAVAGGCRDDNVCFYQHAYYGGDVLRLRYCGTVDLYQYWVDDSDTTWNHVISSWWDSRTDDEKWSRLYDDEWDYVGRTDRPRHEDYVGDARNDRAHFIHVC